MYAFPIAALRELTDRRWLRVHPLSTLSYWVTERTFAPDEKEAALGVLRERDLLVGDPEQLDFDFSVALGVLADPVVRVRVVRGKAGHVPRSTLCDGDGLSFVSIRSDGREVVISGVQTLEDVGEGVETAIVGSSPCDRGPRMDIVGAELALLMIVAPAAERGELTPAALREWLLPVKKDMVEAEARAALRELVTAGWLLEDRGRFTLSPARRTQLDVVNTQEFVDLHASVLHEDGGTTVVRRFCVAGTGIWQVQPFVAGHDTPAPEHASDTGKLVALLGLSLVPSSREMIRQAVRHLLGLDLGEPPAKKGPALGVSLRGRR